MRGAPAKAIQELAGHESQTTTLRYMHLSPGARANAIRLLNERPADAEPSDEGQNFGEIVETAGVIRWEMASGRRDMHPFPEA